MKGKLNDQPLVELIREISSKGFSGSLRLEHERAKTAVYFEDGRVSFAASNLSTLRLREYLKKRALVSEKEMANFEESRSDLNLADALSKKGVLRREDIDSLLSTVVSDTLRVALLWGEGTWEFNERARLDETISVKVETNNLLREAALRMPWNLVVSRFRNPNEMISRTPDLSTIDNCLPAESFILSRLDSPIKLEELIAVSGLPEEDAQRTIYGLLLSGLVKREYWQNAFRTGAAKPTREPTVVKRPPPVSVSEPEPAENRWGSTNEEVDLRAFFARLSDAVTYYEILDLPRTAEASEVKDSYYALARRYHPDRFHLKSGTELHAQISSAFARITHAYETLTNPKTKSAYDLALDRSKQSKQPVARSEKVEAPPRAPDQSELEMESPESKSAQAEHNFREGFGALEQGRTNAAITQLAAACRLDPQQAKYRAYYGRALAAEERTRRLAETELQTAVKLEPANPTYRTMLAELYFDLKFYRRSQSELDRALALDPKNPGALSLLHKLERSSKVG
ncbi:MAG: DnaJ domain-containing protein [Acidobacteriota bacterium]|nr:DnaJ domain-containing protein [Acidobacteriota bacterium]